MRVQDIGEDALVRRLCDRLEKSFGVDKRILVGLGDDAAVVEVGGRRLIVTIDTQLEDTHFRRRWMSPFDLGWKAVAISLSDIVAMGGRPFLVLFSIGLTGQEKVDFVDALYDGATRICRETGALLLGGDTVRSHDRLFVVSAAIGVLDGEPITRSGARVGDVVVVTGYPGEAAAGFWLLEKNVPPKTPDLHACLERFRRPRPRTDLVDLLHRFAVHALVDISDGLVIDAQRLASASQVGITFSIDSVPIQEGVRQAGLLVGKDPLQLALTGGEDYELLVIIAPREAGSFCQFVRERGVPAHVIGEVVAGPKGEVVGVFPDGRVEKRWGGYQHF